MMMFSLIFIALTILGLIGTKTTDSNEQGKDKSSDSSSGCALMMLLIGGLGSFIMINVTTCSEMKSNKYRGDVNTEQPIHRE